MAVSLPNAGRLVLSGEGAGSGSQTDADDPDHESPQRFHGQPSSNSSTDSSDGLKDCDEGDALSEMSRIERRRTIDRQMASINAMEDHDRRPKVMQDLLSAVWDVVRPDFITKHLNWQSVKPVIRTWCAWWTVIVLMSIPRVTTWVGQTAFLLLVAAFIEHSGGVSVTAGLFTSVLDLAFVCFGFMHVVIGNAVAWSIRGRPTKQSCLDELVALGLCPASPADKAAACLIDRVHEGHFLNTKATVVNIIAMLFAFMICGYLPTRRRLFILPWMFSSIAVCATGFNLVSQPWFEPWLYGRAVVVPIGIALGVRFFYCCVIFPTSSNEKFYNVLMKFGTTVKDNFNGYANEQTAKLPSDDDYDTKIPQYIENVNQALVGFGVIELDGLVSRFEVCYSRLDPGNLGEFRSLIRLLATSLSGFQFFHEGMAEKRDAIKDAVNGIHHDTLRVSESNNGPSPLAPVRSSRRRIDSFCDHATPPKGWLGKKLHQHYKSSGNYEIRHQDFNAGFNWDTEQSRHMTLKGLDTVYRAIVDHYRELTDATLACLTACCTWMEEANKYRVLSLLVPMYRHKRRRLQAANAQEVARVANELYKAINKMEDSKEWLKNTFHQKDQPRSRYHYAFSLGQDSFYGYVARQCAVRAEQLASYCMVMDKLQPKPRFIWPFTKSHSRRPRFESEYVSSESLDLGAAGDQQHKEVFAPIQSVQRRDPDSSPPRTPFHLAGRAFQRVYRIFSGRTFGFLMKRSAVTIASGGLYFCRPTADFAYAHRTLWVPILVMFTTSQHAVDGIYGWVSKLGFSCIGALIGMVVWYISTGNGRGNSYGLCAALGVAMVGVAFHRHYNKHRVPATTTIMTVTIGLVVGTSWVDARTVTAIELGYGFRVTWIRLVEVIIAVTIAFIFTMVPHPTTAKKTVRVTIGRCLERIGDLQSSISNFGLQRYNDPQVRIAPREDIIIQKKMGVLSNLSVAKGTSRFIDFEPPLGGVWPKHRYRLLIKLEMEITQLFGHLHYLLDGIEDANRLPEIMTSIGWTNSEITSAAYSVLCMTSRALVSGEPLPSITPAHLSEVYTKRLEKALHYSDRESYEGAVERNYNTHDGRMMLAAMTISAYIYEHLDGIMILVKSLVGEMFDTDPRLYDFDVEAQYLRPLGECPRPKMQ